MTRITPDDLNVVNDAVWAVRREMDQMSERYNKPVTDFLSVECDSSGLFWMSELSNMVEEHLSSNRYLEGLSVSLGDVSFSSQWRTLYHVAVFETLLGYLYRTAAMSGSPDSYHSSHVRRMIDMAHKYEESVLDRFSRWSDWSNLGEMSDWSMKWYMNG